MSVSSHGGGRQMGLNQLRALHTLWPALCELRGIHQHTIWIILKALWTGHSHKAINADTIFKGGRYINPQKHWIPVTCYNVLRLQSWKHTGQTHERQRCRRRRTRASQLFYRRAVGVLKRWFTFTTITHTHTQRQLQSISLSIFVHKIDLFLKCETHHRDWGHMVTTFP